MADVTEAPTQDTIAESLLGEPQEQVVEQPVAEQQPETEVQEQPVEQEQQTEQEVAEDWLPTEQDKVFPDEVLSRYCQRYGLDENMLANPQLKQLVIDKINTDIYLQQQQEYAQQPVEPEIVEEPTPAQPLPTREQYFANITQQIAQRTDPQVAKDFYNEFINAFKAPAEQQPMMFTQVMSKYALNLINTFIPDILQAQLQNQISQAYPGFGDMYERSSYAMSWDAVRNSAPQFASLPAYGSKEFSKVMRDAAARVPGFDEMQFTDGQGKPLGMMENAQRKYTMLAQIASGQNVDPQLMQRAVATQAARTRSAQVKRAAGNLGSGQSKAGAGPRGNPSQFQSNQDIFDESTMELWQREHGRL